MHVAVMFHTEYAIASSSSTHTLFTPDQQPIESTNQHAVEYTNEDEYDSTSASVSVGMLDVKEKS